MSILDRVLTLIRDDSYAATFQSLGQYRAALLQAVRGEAAETGANGLLPCPFCGGTDSFVERLDNCSAYVMCSNMLDEHSCCTARGPNGIQEDDDEEIPGAAAAIAAWNQRAAPAVQGELGEAGLYAAYLLDNWDGEGDTYWLVARKQDDGIWVSEESGRPLIKYEGDRLLKIIPLGSASKPEDRWPAPDAINQIAFEEGQPAEDGDGYLFTAEEFDLLVERLLSSVTPAQPAEQQSFKWPLLDAPALIGGVVVGKGCSTGTVVAIAKRKYQYETEHSPEEHARRERAFREALAQIRQGLPPATPVEQGGAA